MFDDSYDPLLIEAFQAQPPQVLAPVPALRAAFAATFAGLTAQQQAEQKERITLTLTVPRLRAAMLDKVSQAMQLLARAMAERAGRRPDDFAVRTVAGRHRRRRRGGRHRRRRRPRRRPPHPHRPGHRPTRTRPQAVTRPVPSQARHGIAEAVQPTGKPGQRIGRVSAGVRGGWSVEVVADPGEPFGLFP